MRTGSPPWAVIASRIAIAANSASSGSPRKVIAAPSPVSSTMRSRGAMSASAWPTMALKRCLSASCSATAFFEYSTMSRKTMLQTSVRLEGSAMGSAGAESKAAKIPRRVYLTLRACPVARPNPAR